MELRDTNTNCVIRSLAICCGIRLWLAWAVEYVVTFVQTQVHAEPALQKGDAFAPPRVSVGRSVHSYVCTDLLRLSTREGSPSKGGSGCICTPLTPPESATVYDSKFHLKVE